MALKFEVRWSRHQVVLEEYICSLIEHGLSRNERMIQVICPKNELLQAAQTKGQVGWAAFKAQGNEEQERVWLKQLIDGLATPFAECWKDHGAAISARSSKLLDPYRPAPFAYSGDLTADTFEDGETGWPEFHGAGDLEREKRWLLHLQTHRFLEEWRTHRVKNRKAEDQYNRLVKRHIRQEVLEKQPEKSRLAMTQEDIMRREEHLTAFERLAARMCNRDLDLADDLVVETFVRAYDSFPMLLDLGNEEKERRWLLEILKHKVIDNYRLDQSRNKRTGGPIESLDAPNLKRKI